MMTEEDKEDYKYFCQNCGLLRIDCECDEGLIEGE